MKAKSKPDTKKKPEIKIEYTPISDYSSWFTGFDMGDK